MASPPWVILGRIPRVASDDDHPIGYGDLSLALAVPPAVTILNVSQRICPDPTTPTNFPSVLTVDSSGFFLLSATQGPPTAPLVIHKPDGELVLCREFVPGFFVCYAELANAVRLPDPENPISNPRNLGLLIPRGDDYYKVAEIQMTPGSDSATLLCFSPETEEWDEKRLHYPLRPDRLWRADGVISYYGRLWLSDLSWGLLTDDPFDDSPALRFVPLLEGKVLPCTPISHSEKIDEYRCVKVSDGNLRFVEMTRGPLQTSPRLAEERVPRVHAPSVSMWTLDDPEGEEWTLEYEASFAEIWDDESYKAAGLPEKAPVLALVHPRNPNVVYFFLEEYLFGVNMRANRVVEYGVHELVVPQKDTVSPSSVHAWEIPPVISHASTAESTNELNQKDTSSEEFALSEFLLSPAESD